MRFGPVALADAGGAINAHTLRAGERVIKKGRVLDGDDLAALAAVGRAEVTVARLEPGEVGEDEAAAAVAAAIAGPGVRVEDASTGRANLFATVDGLAVIGAAAVDAVNRHDEAITCATVPRFAPVRRGDMVATVKIIRFAATAEAVAAAGASGRGAVEVRAWRRPRAGLVLTRTDGVHDAQLDRAAAAQRGRLADLGGALVAERRTPHDAGAVAAAIAELRDLGLDPVLVLGASAVMDRDDVIPDAIRRAGGEVVRFGMPVDPGNLLVLATLGTTAVIGVPGCARSRKRSGFDGVLERLVAGLAVGADDLTAMGVGGLLDEVPARPHPRAGEPGVDGDGRRARFAAIVLAAGRSSRMGSNKLLADLDGRPLVRHAVEAALGSQARPVVVVTGNQADAVRAALAGLDVELVHNPAHADGMSTSLVAGVAAVRDHPDLAGAVICLGDMPRVRAHHIDAIVAAAAGDRAAAIVVPTCERKRGNPVLLRREVFDELAALDGDVGARALIERDPARVHWLALDDPAILLDVDTPGALAELTSAS